jgi:hypothetical protein
MRLVALSLLSFLIPAIMIAQVSSKAIEDAWEPEERDATASQNKKNFSLLPVVADQLISFYQTNISPQSISRCPFKISCSMFAQKAIERYGIFGVAMFIDRYYYRENHEAFAHYKLVVTDQGILKLDDALFLFERQN